MTAAEVAALRKKAEAASPGPWYLNEKSRNSSWGEDRALIDIESINDRIAEAVQENTAAYIAAVNPAAILAMCEQLERLQQIGRAMLNWYDHGGEIGDTHIEPLRAALDASKAK